MQKIKEAMDSIKQLDRRMLLGIAAIMVFYSAVVIAVKGVNNTGTYEASRQEYQESKTIDKAVVSLVTYENTEALGKYNDVEPKQIKTITKFGNKLESTSSNIQATTPLVSEKVINMLIADESEQLDSVKTEENVAAVQEDNAVEESTSNEEQSAEERSNEEQSNEELSNEELSNEELSNEEHSDEKQKNTLPMGDGAEIVKAQEVNTSEDIIKLLEGDVVASTDSMREECEVKDEQVPDSVVADMFKEKKEDSFLNDLQNKYHAPEAVMKEARLVNISEAEEVLKEFKEKQSEEEERTLAEAERKAKEAMETMVAQQAAEKLAEEQATEQGTEENQAEEACSEAENVNNEQIAEIENAASNAESGALVASAVVDPLYVAPHLNVDDRDLFERIVMGEAGNQGFAGAALVAQSLRDNMVEKGTTSVSSIRSIMGYTGTTKLAPNDDVKQAVAYVLDMNGNAVQHKVNYFYNPHAVKSKFHESQTFLVEYGDHRFFSNNK